MIDPDSFLNAKKKWYPELQECVPKATKIFLGNKAKIAQDQRVLKGTDTVEWLEELVDVLLKISKDFSKIADPNSAVAILQKLAVTLPPTLNRLKSELSILKSKKVFTE